jgi:hypothetical protein
MFYNLNDNDEMTCAWSIVSENSSWGVIGNWTNCGLPENDESNFFYLYNVADELIDAIAVEQEGLNSRLQALYDEAVARHQPEFSVFPDILAAFETELANALAELTIGKATEAQIAALQIAYDKYLMNLEGHIVLAEGTPYENDEIQAIGKVSYTRTLPNLEWNALYLPVEISVAELSDNYDVAYFNNMHAYDRNSDGTIDEMDMEIFLINEGTLHANHPYFIRAKNEAAKQLQLIVNNVVLHPSEETSLTCSSVYTDFTLTGNYTRYEAEDLSGCYAINTSGAWSPIATGSYLNPFRFYLRMTNRNGTPVKIDEAMKSIRIRIHGEGETTGIIDTTINNLQPAIIYDLKGHRVMAPQKNKVYIVSGKKVVF